MNIINQLINKYFFLFLKNVDLNHIYIRGLNYRMKNTHNVKTLDKVCDTFNDKVSFKTYNIDDTAVTSKINENDMNHENGNNDDRNVDTSSDNLRSIVIINLECSQFDIDDLQFMKLFGMIKKMMLVRLF